MAEIQDFKRDVSTLLAPLLDLRGVLPEIAEILRSSVDRNFQVGGRTGSGEYGGGSQKWIPSDRAREEEGQTLVDTGGLAASITYRISGNSIVVGSNKIYASTQQFGDPDRNIEAREFVVVQDEDLEDFDEAITDYYTRLF